MLTWLFPISLVAAIFCFIVAFVRHKRPSNDRHRVSPIVWALSGIVLLCAGIFICTLDLKRMGEERAVLEHEYARKAKEVKFWSVWRAGADTPGPHGTRVELIMDGESHSFILKTGPDRKPRLYREDD